MIKPAEWIRAFSAADGPPPQTLMAFLSWCFRGAFKPIALGGSISILAGILEVITALILGLVIDAALADQTAGFFGSNTGLLLGVVAFFVLLRPIVLGVSGVMQSVVIAPALMSLVMSRLFRHTLGQSVTFFDDDFAGRIAQKQMQAASALMNLVVEFVHTVVFAMASVVGSLVLVPSVAKWLKVLPASGPRIFLSKHNVA